jgi:hypothetical protein
MHLPRAWTSPPWSPWPAWRWSRSWCCLPRAPRRPGPRLWYSLGEQQRSMSDVASCLFVCVCVSCVCVYWGGGWGGRLDPIHDEKTCHLPSTMSAEEKAMLWECSAWAASVASVVSSTGRDSPGGSIWGLSVEKTESTRTSKHDPVSLPIDHSPVKEELSTLSPSLANTRTSAGTRPPLASFTKSPTVTYRFWGGGVGGEGV